MELTCPVCGSEEVYRGQARRKVFAIWYIATMPAWSLAMIPGFRVVGVLWVLFPILFPFLEGWRCRNCGARLTNG
jgi:hypothetical protein